MSFYSDLEDALYKGTTESLAMLDHADVPAIFSHANGTEPASTYCVINILNTQAIGRAAESTTIDSLVGFVYTQQYEITVRFSFLGSDSGEVAFNFFENINKNRLVREKYQTYGISPWRKSDVRRVPQLRTTTWVDSFNLDVTFAFNYKTTQLASWVDQVRIKDERGSTSLIPPTI